MKANTKATIDMPCAAWLLGAARPMTVTMKTTGKTMP